MKNILLVIALLSLSACAAIGTSTAPSRAATAAAGSASLWQQLPGEYDNHAQVWQAKQAKAALAPVHVRQQIVAVPNHAQAWDWQLSMAGADGKMLVAHWRYQLRELADGTLMLTPARELSDSKHQGGQSWAELAPCAMHGSVSSGRLRFSANKDACSAIIAGLGSDAALLPLSLDFNGNILITQTYSDLARGDNARQAANRVRWYEGWVAINGAGPDAEADSKDWHMQRDLRIGNQGQGVPIRWRDGNPSGYSLKLETLDYRKRDMQVLRLSLIRDQDGSTVAYAWADPDAQHIGLNLGWLQTGLTRGQGGKTPTQ